MNNNFGLLFPGQGSQYVGMGKDLYEMFPGARDVYERAEEVLEMSIRKISFEGPEELLRQTRYTQPAILTHSLAVLEMLGNIKTVIVAGHSLGEYSALYAAGSLDFISVMKLVKRRAELMFNEGEKRPGMMAAVIGLDARIIEEICDGVSGVVVPANYNEPKQIVIAGEPPAVQAAMELAKQQGALKVVALPVSGAFHSPLLSESAREFAEYLEQFEIKTPQVPVVMNVTGMLVTTAGEVKSNLARQLISPVQWIKTVITAKNSGCQYFIEVGPGRVLSGLVKRIAPEVHIRQLGKAEEWQAFVEGR